MADTIQAGQASIGGWYDTQKGRRVQVRRKENGRVYLFSQMTGNVVYVAGDYMLRPFYETLFR